MTKTPATSIAWLQLGHVHVQVADARRSSAFYQDTLGLTRLDRSDVRLGTPDGTPLVELRERPGASPVGPRGRLGLFHFAILLPDRPSLGRFFRHVAGTGLVTGTADHAVSEAIYLSDPDGLGIEVYADRPREQWRYESGELSMTTEPLAVRGLMSVAGEEPWAGMPAGTAMGHVHLSVASLGEAVRFYRDGLGLEPTVSSYPGALFLSAGGYHHHLGLNTWSSGAPQAGPDDARLLDWRIALPSPADVDAVVERLRRIGISTARDGDGVRATDPWGTDVVISS
jgi:catechol 2,3-dioxygenase